ncbi:MAG: hypothetical protein KUG82_09655 [Pseudomonadales bacterium]|nr:hypothetical protein [Pseudomonadales bacterium]
MTEYIRNTARFQTFNLLACAWLVIVHSSTALEFLPLDAYLQGEHIAPFQTRIFVVWLALPIIEIFEFINLADILKSRPAPFNDANHVAFMIINFFSIAILVNLIRLHFTLLKAPLLIRQIAPFGIFYILPFTLFSYPSSNYWLPYDLSGVLFFYSLILLIAYNKDHYFLLLLPLAILNRETTIFTAGILILIRLLEKRYLRALVISAVSVTLFIVLKAWLHQQYSTNSAGSETYLGLLEYQFSFNLSYLSNPMWWPSIMAMFGFLWIPVFLCIRDIEDNVIKIATLCFPLYLLIMLFVGHIVEMRIFNEYSTVFLVAAVLVFLNKIQKNTPV